MRRARPRPLDGTRRAVMYARGPPEPSRLAVLALAARRRRRDGAHRPRALHRAGQGSLAGAARVLHRARGHALRRGRAAAQGQPADAHRDRASRSAIARTSGTSAPKASSRSAPSAAAASRSPSATRARPGCCRPCWWPAPSAAWRGPAIPALLRTRFNANEILTSLMLVYVANLALSLARARPVARSRGLQLPAIEAVRRGRAAAEPAGRTRDSTRLPDRARGGRARRGSSCTPRSPASACASRGSRPRLRAMRASRRARTSGSACCSAARARASPARTRSAGPIGQLLPTMSPGYGFAAIIVAFVGRLHPLGIVLASLLMSLLYLGGEAAQIRLGLPSAVTGLVPGHAAVLPARAPTCSSTSACACGAAPARGCATYGARWTSSRHLVVLTLAAGTPLVFAALGELVVEKSGVLNLGVEGMMLVGAVCAVHRHRATPAIAVGRRGRRHGRRRCAVARLRGR